MKVRVTSISWEDASEGVRSVTMDMESALSASFRELSFGAEIDQITIVIISVSSEDAENDRLCKGYDKIRKVRNPFTKQSIKSIGLAVPINTDVLVRVGGIELRTIICAAALQKIANPAFRIPKSFDYEKFSHHLSAAIAAFSRARIN